MGNCTAQKTHLVIEDLVKLEALFLDEKKINEATKAVGDLVRDIDSYDSASKKHINKYAVRVLDKHVVPDPSVLERQP